ncbi:serine hydrolase [Streptomyces aurantiacus]|uniref:Serine hydrolase n=1 Tax=Streptomyces aurantiacus TaxID=47760 RepID=A0A7G1NUR3_9ACTN|nr:serine hydrolase [Streptomyces aurantiacus]BCL25306.1 serine hydrolase [Streptomyces aurantiacus]
MTRPLRLADLAGIATPEQPALSPDGERIAYVLRTSDLDADRHVRNLWLVPGAGGDARQLTRGGNDHAPGWSPDGTRIAFLRAGDGPAQLWQLPADGGEAEPLTTLPLGAGTPVWSPDGTRIAFTAPVDIAAAPGTPGPRGPNPPVVIDRLDYQTDGGGLVGTVRRHLHVLDLATGDCRRLTDGDWYASPPAWSPDGTRLAFTAATAPNADLTAHSATHVLALDDPTAVPVRVGLPEGRAATVDWTADGTALLVVGHLKDPVGHARLLHVPLDDDAGTGVTDLAASLDRNVMPGGPGYPGALPQLARDGGTVLFCVRDRGCTHLYAVGLDGDPAERRPRLVLGGAGHIVSGMAVRGHTVALVLATPTSFGEIVVLDLASGTRTVRTAHGSALSDVELFPRVEREFTISDGTVVQGWLTGDPAAQDGTPRPLLLDIHGGPHNAWNAAADSIHLYHQVLAARGWNVLLVNPRGSDGYGERFFDAVNGAWGLADAQDFLEPVDTLVAEGVADPDRLAVTGYSYGGYMTCYLTGHDDRFAAAVAGGVVSDLTSMAGAAEDGHFLAAYELGGPPWALRERYEAMSPLTRVEDVRTPTLILHGTDDLVCPVGQASQWHTALRERDVPTQLVLYPGGSHLFVLDGPPSHLLDFNGRVAEWVERHAGGSAGRRRPPVDGAYWQRRLAALAAKHRVPGATLGILRIRPDGAGAHDDELVEVAHGVLNLDTGTPTTTDSLFQIGSVSKVWTATLVMQLVDEGLLDLDAPLVTVLPELVLADPETTKAVTMRHLLTHTSGIDGDVFTDTGRGDDCLETYVAGLADVRQNHPLGATWSYCNSGFSLMGRVVEQLTGMTWDRAIRERVFAPLGLRHTVTLPEEALLHSAAVGHEAHDGGSPQRAPVWGLPRSLGPAGLITSTTADVLAFARAHLNGGRTADGGRLLSGAGTEAMAARHAELPDPYTLGDSWGLGWCRFTWDGHFLLGHDGNTIGQSAFLRLLPAEGLAVTLLTNGGHTRDLYEDLFQEIFAELAGLDMPRTPAPPQQPPVVDVGPHTGVYERAGARMEVLERDGGGVLRITVTGPLAELVPDPVEEFPLIPLDASGERFAVRSPESTTWQPVIFYTLPTGERYMHHGVRATPKAATS